MQSIDRHQWDDSDWRKVNVPLNVNPDNMLKEVGKPGSQNFIYEDFNIACGVILKNRKSGVADPRFKRVVPAGMPDEIAIEARKVSESFTRAAASRDEFKPAGNDASFSKASKIPTFSVKKNVSEQSGNHVPAPNLKENASEMYENCVSNVDRNRNCGYNNFQEVAELDGAAKEAGKPKCRTGPSRPHQVKKSVSDCTLATKNASVSEEDGGEEFNRLQSFTSTTRLSKVNNWIKEFKAVPEKRRSVITVIGQTKGKSFSTVLNEINQRRKLAKELDKHALCETIIQAPEKEKELKNLIAKVDFMSPDGKIMYTARKIYGFRDASAFDAVKTAKCEDIVYNSCDTSKPGTTPCKMSDEIPERDVPAGLARKRKSRRSTKKIEACRKLGIKGAMQMLLDCLQNQTVASAVVLAGVLAFGVILFVLKEKRLLNYLNIGKPKARTWYDELFR